MLGNSVKNRYSRASKVHKFQSAELSLRISISSKCKFIRNKLVLLAQHNNILPLRPYILSHFFQNLIVHQIENSVRSFLVVIS
jgi:hypothetical protein